MTTILTVPNADTPLDLLLFATFGREVPGLVEQTLAQNSGLADLGPFLPARTRIIVTPPPPSTASPAPVIRLY